MAHVHWTLDTQGYKHTLRKCNDDDDDDDDDDDCIWVRDLTAPMHLGLIDGPFVPHIKIKGAL
jgi:hypothetical protein